MARWMDRLQDQLAEAGGMPWRLRHARGGALVSPELGGRVLAVDLDGRPALWFHPDLLETGRSPDWNAGGQRTWIAPEHAPQSLFEAGGNWSCPPGLDPGMYREAASDAPEISLDNAFTAGTPGQPLHFQLRRRIRLESSGAALTLRVDQSVEYSGAQRAGACYGAWAILQAPTPGIAIVESIPAEPARVVPGGSVVEGGRLFHDDFFEPVPAGGWKAGDDCLAVAMTGDRQFKVGIPASRLAHTARVNYFFQPEGAGRILRITQECSLPPGARYAEAPGGEPSPEGDAVQLYNHLAGGRLGYAELECHGPAGHPGSGISTVSVRYEFDWLSRSELSRILRDRQLADIRGSFLTASRG